MESSIWERWFGFYMFNSQKFFKFALLIFMIGAAVGALCIVYGRSPI